MSSGIFESYALKYFEAGIPVIPLGGKIPLVSGWQEWSKRPQTEDELEWLIEKYPNANIGAVMGLWASALDIDTDNEAVLRSIPYSPLRRKGKKGLIALFRQSPMENKPGTMFPIEFLNHGRQIVLPPSIHPDTGLPYNWIGEESIDSFDFTQLPPITQAQLSNIERVCQHERVTTLPRTRANGSTPVCLTDAGRNNRLSRIAYAMACDAIDADEAIERLLELDEKEHDTPWFSDPTEPHKGKDKQKAALRMYSRALLSAKKRGHRNAELTINLNNILPPNTDKPVVSVPESSIAIPRPRGFMRVFVDYCNSISVGNQDALGLGGAITLMAAIASNRFYTTAGNFDVWPNVFSINLAHSGFGKEVPQKAIDDLLMNTDLLGSATYKSGTSIVMNLPKQQERIDVIDECAMLLRAMCSQEDYKSEIVDILSSLYTKSNSRFLGFASRADGPRFGACWNPCVNILGSTTPQGFKGSVSRDMAAKGLMPRFLVFWQKEVGEFKGDFDRTAAEAILRELKRLTNIYLSTEKKEHADSAQINLLEPDPEADPSKRYQPELIPMSDGATKLWRDIFRKYYDEGRIDPESFESAFKNRFAQHTAKLALLDTLSQGLAEIGVDSIEWAHSVVQWQWQTVKELYELAASENLHEKNVLRVLQFAKEHGTFKRSEVSKRFRYLWGQQLDGILKQLQDEGCIIRVPKEPGKGRPAEQFMFQKDLLKASI